MREMTAGSSAVTTFAIALAGACGGSPPPPSTQAPAPAGTLAVELQLYVERGGQRVAVPRGGVVNSGEMMHFEITPTQPAYLYVVEVRADGTTDVLVGLDSDHVTATTGTAWVPPKDADYEVGFDEIPGKEQLYVIASPRPLGEIDAQAYALVRKNREPAPAPALAPPPTAPAIAADPPPPPTTTPPIDPPPPATTPAPVTTTHAVGRASTPPRASGGMQAPVGLTIRGAMRKQKATAKLVVDADRDNVVVFPYDVDHR
jgi:hypothetical protein